MSPASALGFPRVLCPIDFSRHSRAALRYAHAIVQQLGGQLTVLTALDPMLTAAAATATRDPHHLDTTTMKELRRFVVTTIGSEDAAITLKMVVGHPAHEIDRIARLVNADLVVMGTHGLSGPKKWFFGSTTESLFRRSSVPVLAVPARSRGPFRRGRGASTVSLVAPIELDGETRSEIRPIMAIAGRLGARVQFLHVVKPAQVPSWLGRAASAADRQRAESAQKPLQRLVEPFPAARFRVVIGDPVDEIEKAASKEKAAAIVMTLRDKGALGPRRGSITYRVVCSGNTPVLALPPPGR